MAKHTFNSPVGLSSPQYSGIDSGSSSPHHFVSFLTHSGFYNNPLIETLTKVTWHACEQMTHTTSLFTNYITHCSLSCSTSSEFSDLSKTSNSTDRGTLSWRCNRSRSRRWLINIDIEYFTVLLSSIRFIENGEKVQRSLCTRFIFILFIVLARCSLGLDHRSTIDLWLDMFCSCSCSRALTAANCHYALWRQISHVHVTLLWRECFYGAINMKLDTLRLQLSTSTNFSEIWS